MLAICPDPRLRIGAATARAAVKAGYRVAVNYVSDEAAAKAVVAIIEQAGGEAFAVQPIAAATGMLAATQCFVRGNIDQECFVGHQSGGRKCVE